METTRGVRERLVKSEQKESDISREILFTLKGLKTNCFLLESGFSEG